jgi:hypothetical protein
LFPPASSYKIAHIEAQLLGIEIAIVTVEPGFAKVVTDATHVVLTHVEGISNV